jgi:hypothetical protein
VIWFAISAHERYVVAVHAVAEGSSCDHDAAVRRHELVLVLLALFKCYLTCVHTAVKGSGKFVHDVSAVYVHKYLLVQGGVMFNALLQFAGLYLLCP